VGLSQRFIIEGSVASDGIYAGGNDDPACFGIRPALVAQVRGERRCGVGLAAERYTTNRRHLYLAGGV
jgi:hypothetical protein